MSQDSQTEPSSPHWFLQRIDQAAIAGLVLFALTALAVYWIARGGAQGRLIEIDRATPLTAQFQVDINAADWTELIVLPEIGPALAQRIVEDRAKNGPFPTIEAIDRVPGIGPKTLQRLRPYLRVGKPAGTLADRESK